MNNMKTRKSSTKYGTRRAAFRRLTLTQIRADCLSSYPNSYHTCTNLRSPRSSPLACKVDYVHACICFVHIDTHTHIYTHTHTHTCTHTWVRLNLALRGARRGLRSCFGARVFPLGNGHAHNSLANASASAYKGQTSKRRHAAHPAVAVAAVAGVAKLSSA